MPKLSKNKESYRLELILVVFTVLIVGLASWLIYRGDHEPVTPSSAKAQTNKASSSTASLKYLIITQWKVEVPYTSTDTLSYVISSSNANLAIIISKQMASKYDCTGTNGLPSGAGSITRSLASSYDSQTASTTSETYAQVALKDTTNYKLVGSYVYGFSRDQSACQEVPTAAGSAAQTKAENFTNSLIPKLQVES